MKPLVSVGLCIVLILGAGSAGASDAEGIDYDSLPPELQRMRQEFLERSAREVLRPALEDGVKVEYLEPDAMKRPLPGEHIYEENVRRAKQALSSVDSQVLVKILRRVTGTGIWAYQPCYECIAAAELLADRSDPADAHVLQEAYDRYGYRYPRRKPDQERYLSPLLAGWMSTALPAVSGKEAIAWVRAVMVDSSGSAIHSRAAHAVLLKEVEIRGWGPEVMALFDDTSARVRLLMCVRTKQDAPETPEHVRDRMLDYLLDSDAKIRELAHKRLEVRPLRNERALVPALERFLNRADVTRSARLAAEAGLEARGFRARRIGGRWVAERLSE